MQSACKYFTKFMMYLIPEYQSTCTSSHNRCLVSNSLRIIYSKILKTFNKIKRLLRRLRLKLRNERAIGYIINICFQLQTNRAYTYKNKRINPCLKYCIYYIYMLYTVFRRGYSSDILSVAKNET